MSDNTIQFFTFDKFYSWLCLVLVDQGRRLRYGNTWVLKGVEENQKSSIKLLYQIDVEFYMKFRQLGENDQRSGSRIMVYGSYSTGDRFEPHIGCPFSWKFNDLR